MQPWPDLARYEIEQYRRRGQEQLDKFTLREALSDRTRGAVCLERVGASLSTTPGAQVEAPGYQGNQGSIPSTTSRTASMVGSRGAESAQKAMPHHGGAGQSQRLDPACRQSPTRELRRPGRSGMAAETRATQP